MGVTPYGLASCARDGTVGIIERRNDDERRRARRIAFAQNLQAILDAQDLTHREFADRCDWPNHSRIYPWLRGHAEPDPETVFRMEDVLGVAPGSLSRPLGYVPADLVEATPPTDVAEVIRRHQLLPELVKRMTLAVYEEAMRISEERRRSSGDGPAARG